MAEVLQDCGVLIEPAGHASAACELVLPDFDQPCYIHADLTRVKQVMINLLSNAIKYNRPGGSVTVRCERHGEERVRMYVKDTGVGLSEDQIGQLFQPFNRLGQEQSTEEGTGIGLVVTKQLVELMGGQIGVESALGVGTEFWVEFPASQRPELAGAGDMPAVRRIKRWRRRREQAQRTVLYVEDNPANLALVEQLIARRGDLKLLTRHRRPPRHRAGARLPARRDPDGH